MRRHEPRACERSWLHFNYLRGTLYCSECGGRLMYTRVRGKTGAHYHYFVCRGRQRKTCTQPNHRLQAVEEAIEHYYARVRLSKADRDRIGQLLQRQFQKVAALSG